MLKSEEGIKLVPELYTVPHDSVNDEYKKPGSSERKPVGRCPFLWGQSLYILGKLLQEVRVHLKDLIFDDLLIIITFRDSWLSVN